MISKDINTNIENFKTMLAVDKNFDIVYRSFKIAETKACIFFIDGFIKDDTFQRILQYLMGIESLTDINSAYEFSKQCMPYCEVSLSKEDADISAQILSGVCAVFIDGCDSAVMVDTRTYPQEASAAPDRDKTFRGSKDAFVEILIMNCALIRRRIRSEDLRVEHMQVGQISKTDIAICYMDKKANKETLKIIKDKLENTKIKALTINQETLSEVLLPKKWYTILPRFKYTERPDGASAQILEGDIVLLIDNCPYAMILPITFFDILDEANDYYFPPITSSYLKITRFLITFLAVFLTPTWVLLIQNPEFIPDMFKFILIDEPASIPIILQFLILELAIDGLKLATLNTSSMLSTPLSIISGIIVGDFAVKSGWFCGESILYMAFVTIANYNQPNFEMGYAFKFMRMFLLIMTYLFNFIGFVCAVILIAVLLCTAKAVDGKGYMYPLIPFNASKLKDKIFRRTI